MRGKHIVKESGQPFLGQAGLSWSEIWSGDIKVMLMLDQVGLGFGLDWDLVCLVYVGLG